MVSASHSFPLRTVLDAFVQFASIHSCNNFTGTQQHNCPLLSTTSVFLVVLFRRDAWFPAQTATSSYTQQNARFLFRPPRKRPNAYFYFLQSVFSIFRTVRQRTTLSFSLRLPSMCVHPAMIHLTSLGPAHTGRSRLPPHRSYLLRNQMLETQLLAVGPFANSSWTDLQLRCAQHDDSDAADVPRGTSSLLGCFGESAFPVVSTCCPKVTPWFAHGSVHTLRFSAEADASVASSHVHCKRKNRMDFFKTVSVHCIYTNRQLSRQICPATTAHV